MKKRKKAIALLLSAAVFLSNFSTTGNLKEVQAATNVAVKNADFENTTTNSNGITIPVDWSDHDYAETVDTDAQSGSKCLKITNPSNNYSAVTQQLQLEPNTEYTLTGYIKGDNIIGQQTSSGYEYGDGATIDFEDDTAYMVDHTNNWMTGTFGWTKVTLHFVTNSSGMVTLRCRLGHYWGNAMGTAYFDNITITKQAYPDNTDRVKLGKKNVCGYIRKEIVDSIGMSTYDDWMNDLQAAYEAYNDLTGSIPHNGDILNVKDTEEPFLQMYGAIANFNPILLNKGQDTNFQNYAQNKIIDFGILHEIGHKFDTRSDNRGDYGWNFNGEFWANTKMLYVLDETDHITTSIGGVTASSSAEMEKYYKTISSGGYDNTIAQGIFNDSSYDALTYIIIKIVQEIGWEPFKATFRDYVNNNVGNVYTTFDKFNTFLNTLQKNYNPNGTEVMDCIGTNDFNIIRKSMLSDSPSELSDLLQYNSIVEGEYDWQGWCNGNTTSGTVGEGKKITAFTLDSDIDISYRAYINNHWTDWQPVSSVISGNGYDIEAMQFKLNGESANKYNIYYRTENKFYGWLGWASNGNTSGTLNTGSTIEGYEVLLMYKDVILKGITTDKIVSYINGNTATHLVTFKSYDGTILKTETVEHGGNATPPSDPIYPGYTFTGWSGSYNNITANTELTAQYTRTVSITSLDINNGEAIIAGKEACFIINTNFPNYLTYSLYVFTDDEWVPVAKNFSTNTIKWIIPEELSDKNCIIQIHVYDYYENRNITQDYTIHIQSATATPTPTATATPSPTATATPSPTATATPSPTATATNVIKISRY